MYKSKPKNDSYLDSLIGITDDTNEQAKHHVDEQWDEGVKVDFAKHPHSITLLVHLSKRHEHIITIN